MRTFVLGGLAAAITVMVVGNAAILSMSLWARRAAPAQAAPASVPGVEHLVVVDDQVWRGSAPNPSGYRALAASGVTTVIDLRAEDNVRIDRHELHRVGIRRVHIPIRDGQAPSSAKVERFLETVRASEGRVFVHCGAGVGRTGTMAAAYLVATGGAGSNEAIVRNLAVGPPSLEQLAFVRGLADGRPNRPNLGVTALSRVLDAPRRLWSRYGT